MVTIFYAILLLCAFVAIAYCFVIINELDKRIDEILAEEKRQNKRIDILEKREQLRQSEERRDKVCNDAKDLFKDW